MKTIFSNYKSVLVNRKYKHLMHTNSLSYIYYLPVWHLLLIAPHGSWHFHIQSKININNVPEKFMEAQNDTYSSCRAKLTRGWSFTAVEPLVTPGLQLWCFRWNSLITWCRWCCWVKWSCSLQEDQTENVSCSTCRRYFSCPQSYSLLIWKGAALRNFDECSSVTWAPC